MRALAFALVFASMPALAAPVPKELKTRPDAERMQGVWDFETYDDGGRTHKGTRWYFEKDKMYSGGTDTADDKGWENGIVLRPEANPPEMDIVYTTGPVCQGVYKFVGEELHIAYVHGAVRPTDFASAPGKDVMVMKRGPDVKK